MVKIEKKYIDNMSVISSNKHVGEVLDFIKNDHDRTVKEQMGLCEIPAPSYKEELRAKKVYEKMIEYGLEDVRMDEVNNVIGIRRGSKGGPRLVVAAHLDTVFNETKINLEVVNGIIHAPGIADDTRGLAELLGIARAFNEFSLNTLGEVIFVANVCEEGLGDLRGTKHLFGNDKNIHGFITIDGSGVESIVYEGAGSYRYEVIYNGPGGHSFGDFGLPSTNHAMGRAIAQIADLETKEEPKTTFTVGVVEGGTSVNSISGRSKMLIDLRSSSKEELDSLENSLLTILNDAALKENKRWNKDDMITVEINKIGNRPAGLQSTDSPIVQTAMTAMNALGLEAKLLGPSSTDANLPISLGIPAISTGRGGKSGSIHTLSEWFDPTRAYLGPQKTFLNILSLVGVEGVTDSLL